MSLIEGFNTAEGNTIGLASAQYKISHLIKHYHSAQLHTVARKVNNVLDYFMPDNEKQHSIFNIGC